MLRIELKYKGDRAKIREELGFDMPVRAERKAKTKNPIQDKTQSKGDESKDYEAGHGNPNNTSDVNNTSVAPPQMEGNQSDATVTATSDNVTAKETSIRTVETSNATSNPSSDSNSVSEVPDAVFEATSTSGGLGSSTATLSVAVNASDSVTGSNITNNPVESSNIDKAPGNGAMNPAMFFEAQNTSNNDTIKSSNLRSCAFFSVDISFQFFV